MVLILLIAAICRLYKIDQYMTFLGDEGRDVIIVRRLLVEGHPPLIGPGTSVGQMYLGPIYYYMMAPALWLANFSPVGPAVQIAILGVITVGFIWWVGREWFGKIAGLIAAGLYAISPTVITFSRSSWNPNIMPLFALLSIYSVWKLWREKKAGWLVILGISFAFVMQSHYLGFLLLPTLLIFWYLSKSPTKSSLIAPVLFAILMSPLLFFDLRHNFQNFKAFEALFAGREGVVSLKLREVILNIPLRFDQIITALIGAKNMWTGVIASVFIFLMTTFSILRSKARSPLWILICWIGFGILGFAFYKLPIYDHYFGFLFPAPFLLLGGLVQGIGKMIKPKVLSVSIFVIALLALFAVNIISSPLRFAPNRQLERSQDVARKVLSEEQGKPFDLAVLAERNYEDGYRYFMELWGATVLHADRWDQKTIVNDLIVICEMEEKKCDPTHSPKAEVANFGMSKIDAKWEVDGVIIYRLLHTK